MNSRHLIIMILLCPLALVAVTRQQMEDSLTLLTQFPSVVKPVKINNIQKNNKQVIITTNNTLAGLSLNRTQIEHLKARFRRWLNVKPATKILIYSDKHKLEDLITDRFERRSQVVNIKHSTAPNLTNRIIALWASHGIYYNLDEERWKWQRATLWTMVEDIFSCEFAHLVSTMLKNSGARVVQPRGSWDSVEGQAIGKSGFPRWAESARYWLEYKGFPDSIWHHNQLPDSKDTTLNHYKDDIRCRPRWVNYLCGGSAKNLNQNGLKQDIDLCVALHTDGYSIPYDTATVGTLVIYSETDSYKNKKLGDGSTRLVCRDLADYIQSQLVADIRRMYCPTWSRRQLLNSNYFEVCFPVIPAVIVEILSHAQMHDMQYGLDPHFRFTASRAIYKGILRFLQRDKGIVQPLPVSDFSVDFSIKNSSAFNLSWRATEDSLEPTAKPTSYIIQVRHDDKTQWKDSLTVKHSQITLLAKKGLRYDFRVVAVNEGGRSFPSETLSAFLTTQKTSHKVLIINSFNRICGPDWFHDTLYAGIIPGSFAIPYGQFHGYIGNQFNFKRKDVWKSDDECGFGMCYRDKATQIIVGNTFDYPVQHGKVLAQNNISYCSCNVTALKAINMAQYSLVDVVLGKTLITDTAISILRTYLTTWRKQDSLKMILLSGCNTGDMDFASHTGKVDGVERIYTPGWIQKQKDPPNETGSLIQNATQKRIQYDYAILPNSRCIQAERVSSWKDIGDNEILFRYTDSQLPACIGGHGILRWGVSLESFAAFEKIYTYSIRYLLENAAPQ